MVNENNPYQVPSNGLTHDATTQVPKSLKPARVFTYSYCTSLAVALIVVVIWLMVLFSDTSIPPAQRRTSPPGVVELIFLFATTLPSVLTCLCFSLCYCAMVQVHEERKMWPAVLFGTLSGLIFNAMTAISVIEHFFDW
jgi:hypothetical protein